MEKNLPASAGDTRDVGSVPGSGRPPGGGHGNPLQYSCLENQSPGQRNLVGYSPWGRKDTTEATLARTHAGVCPGSGQTGGLGSLPTPCGCSVQGVPCFCAQLFRGDSALSQLSVSLSVICPNCASSFGPCSFFLSCFWETLSQAQHFSTGPQAPVFPEATAL